MTWVDQEDKTIFSTHDKLDQASNLGLKSRTPLAENQESLPAEIQKSMTHNKSSETLPKGWLSAR